MIKINPQHQPVVNSVKARQMKTRLKLTKAKKAAPKPKMVRDYIKKDKRKANALRRDILLAMASSAWRRAHRPSTP